jgi:hypothetical protein
MSQAAPTGDAGEKKLKKVKKSLTISRKTITTGASQILNQQSTAIL